jgi:hypothetical protein
MRLASQEEGRREVMAIAEEIRWAITTPAIDSRKGMAEGSKNRYALAVLRASGVSAGEERARLTVSKSVASCGATLMRQYRNIQHTSSQSHLPTYLTR